MEVPNEVKKLIKNYFNLKIANKSIKTPYYINEKHGRRGGLRSLVGKGTPTEIEEEVKIFAKLRSFCLEEANEEEIREFMKEEGIGVECSGFVSNILDKWLKCTKQGSLYSNIKFENKNIFDAIIKYIRPVQNISADLLTNKNNTIPVELKDVQAGDLIRFKGLKTGHHIAIITEVKKKSKGKMVKYLHSTAHYEKDNGVKKGEILVKDESRDLGEQEWKEVDENNKCWTLKQYQRKKYDNGIRRPKFFNKKKCKK